MRGCLETRLRCGHDSMRKVQVLDTAGDAHAPVPYEFFCVVISAATSTSTHPLKITLYNEINSRGIALPLTESVPDMSGVTRSVHFPVRSAHIDPGSVWTLYTGVNYTGQHITLRTDASLTFSSGYPIPAESFVVKPNMNDGSSDQHVSLREMAAIQLPVQSVKKMTAEIILYNNNGFRGSNLPLTGSRRSLGSFNDKTSSVIVVSGRWRLYTHSSYKGTSVELSRGSYLMDHLQQTVGNDAVSSVRLQSYD